MSEEAAVSTEPQAAPTSEDAEASPEPQASRRKRMDPARRITLIVLAVVAVLFGWHLMADRATPYTDLGKVDGYVIPIAAQVPGYITEVGVVLNQVVEEGDLIIQIDTLPYQLAVNAARASLELSGQQVRAQTSAIASAAGRLGVSEAQLDRQQHDSGWNHSVCRHRSQRRGHRPGDEV